MSTSSSTNDLERAKRLLYSRKIQEVSRRVEGLTGSRDLLVIFTMIIHCKASKFLEIGTFLGGTSAVIASAFPKIEVITVGFALDESPWVRDFMSPRQTSNELVDSSRIGMYCKNFQNVTILKGNSNSIKTYGKGIECDVAYIDGGHMTNTVIKDTIISLSFGARSIIWHDVDMAEVRAALDYMSDCLPSISVPGTRCAIWHRGYDEDDLREIFKDMKG